MRAHAGRPPGYRGECAREEGYTRPPLWINGQFVIVGSPHWRRLAVTQCPCVQNSTIRSAAEPAQAFRGFYAGSSSGGRGGRVRTRGGPTWWRRRNARGERRRPPTPHPEPPRRGRGGRARAGGAAAAGELRGAPWLRGAESQDGSSRGGMARARQWHRVPAALQQCRWRDLHCCGKESQSGEPIRTSREHVAVI